jgi:phage baseplate assembly protein W
MQGLKFPLEITNGRFSIASERDKLLQNIQHIVKSQVLERDYEPTMGSPTALGLLRNADKSSIQQLISILEQSINTQEPRVQAKLFYDEKQSNTLTGKHTFIVRFAIKDTGSINEGTIVVE